jgi:hypothetical protein
VPNVGVTLQFLLLQQCKWQCHTPFWICRRLGCMYGMQLRLCSIMECRILTLECTTVLLTRKMLKCWMWQRGVGYSTEGILWFPLFHQANNVGEVYHSRQYFYILVTNSTTIIIPLHLKGYWAPLVYVPSWHPSVPASSHVP